MYFQNYTSFLLQQFHKQGMHLVEWFPCKPEAVLYFLCVHAVGCAFITKVKAQELM